DVIVVADHPVHGAEKRPIPKWNWNLHLRPPRQPWPNEKHRANAACGRGTAPTRTLPSVRFRCLERRRRSGFGVGFKQLLGSPQTGGTTGEASRTTPIQRFLAMNIFLLFQRGKKVNV